MNFKSAKSIHFTGIKGVGMTALALIARDLHIKVSGSDVAEVFPPDTVIKKTRLNQLNHQYKKPRQHRDFCADSFAADLF